MARNTKAAPAKAAADINIPQPAEAEAQEEKPSIKVKQRLTPHTYVTVKNGFNGKLVYVSAHTREKFVWSQFGDEQEMELQELKSAKATNKAFFERNYFLFDDPEVIEYLGVGRFYESALTFEEFADLFTWPAEEIESRLCALSKGQKQSLAYMARQQIADGQIDSLKVIDTLEKGLGVELIEH